MERPCDHGLLRARGCPLESQLRLRGGQRGEAAHGNQRERIGLAGALPPSLGELGPSLTELNLFNNAITSVPTELGALTGLTRLDLSENAITSLPTELGALTG